MIRKMLLTLFTFITILAVVWPDGSASAAPARWITITSPNGGEVMTVGSTYRIKWNSSSNINKVSIGYKSCDSCLDWIVTNIPNVGFYDWNVSIGNTNKTQFKIQVIGYQTGVGSVKDYSDANFTINPRPTPTSTVTKTRTPTKTPTNTRTPTPTKTSTNTKTPTITKTSTNTDTPTVTDTLTSTPTDVPTDTPTLTPTPVLLPFGNGTGLIGEYFDNNMDINGAPLYAQLDPQVYFNWNAPVAENVPDDFTVRWTGQIEARSSEEYVFSADADDLVRVWVDGQIYIDDWDNPQGGLLFGPVISLARGQKYDIQVDFRDTGGGASISLYWYTLSNSISWEVIPMQQLYPSVGGLPATATFTPTETPTSTPSETPTETPSSTPTTTATRTITATRTPTRTLTVTPTLTSTFTRTVTKTVTPTFTSTATKTLTPTFTRTPTRTATPTIPTSTQTFTQTPTLTLVSPSPVSSWITVSTPNGGEVLNYAEIYPITWESSSDINSVDILVGYRYTCAGCSTDWNLEWSVGLVPNTGSYDWSIYVTDPTNKEFVVLVQGERFNGSGYDVVAMDESDSTFTVELSDVPTIPPSTQIFTSTTMPTPQIDTNLFEPYITYLVGDGEAIGISDFNNDGLKDVAIAIPSQLLVFLQGMDGTLASPVGYPALARPESLAAGDLNNDGRTDIALLFNSSNTVSVYLQQADGTLANRVTYPTSNSPDSIAIGDVNNDGLVDIVVSHWNAGNIGIFTQNAGGTMNSMVSYASPQAGYDDIAIGDVNGDGLNDVVKMNGQGLNPNLSVYIQNLDGTMANALSYTLGCTRCLSHGLGIGDITGDGLADVVLSYGGNQPTSNIAVFAQISEGTLGLPLSYAAYEAPETVEIADVNSDGLLDVLIAHGGWNTLSVYLQQNNGMLYPYSRYSIPYASHYSPQGLAIGDINNDGLPDVAIADSNHGLVILYHVNPFTPTHTPTAIATFTNTATPTLIDTPDFTHTVTPSPTLSITPTRTPTYTPTITPTSDCLDC